jgi:hypothetical protein
MKSISNRSYQQHITSCITLILILLFISSCKKSTDSTGSSQLVLEGYLFQGEVVDSIHLTNSVSFESTDTTYPPVNDASIMINWNGKSYSLVGIGGGYYNSNDSRLSIEVGNTYSIEVKYKGKTSTSSTVVPAIPAGVILSDTIAYIDTIFTMGPPDIGGGANGTNSIKISWDDSDNGFYFVVIESLDPKATLIQQGNGNFPGGNGPFQGKIFRMRSQPFQGSSYTLQTRSLERYGKHVAKVYRVNQEYADLYMNRQQDSRNLSEPITNVSNGLGIFTGFSYASVYFTVKNSAGK